MSEPIKLGDALSNLGIITKKKYEHLKRFESTITEAEKKMILEYEKYQIQKSVENKKLFKEPKPEKPKIEFIEGSVIFDNFKLFWNHHFKKQLILNDSNERIIKNLCDYFGNEENSSFDKKKGVLLTGDCGVGKTSMMTIFHLMGKSLLEKTNSDLFYFQMINCNDLVEEFESEETETSSFHKKYKTGNKYFDDFGTERIASKYGKSNLMQEILEKRYLDLSWRTYLTSNLTEKEIKEKYGFRVYDRIFEQFNFIELKGNSFRRK